MKISKDVKKELNSFELSELERVLEAIQEYEYYSSGYKNLCGGYSTAEAFGIEECWFDGDEEDGDIDAIEIEVETGLCEGNTTSCTKTVIRFPRNILADKDISLKDKLTHIDWD